MKRIVIALTLLLCTVARAEYQMMTPAEVAAIRAALPDLEDDDVEDMLRNDVTYYTTKQVPPVYQHQNGNGTSRATAHSPYYNISADPSDRGLPHGQGGNAGIEFPWRVGVPGGTHRALGVKSIKGFVIPKPVAVFERTVNGRVRTGNRTIIVDWVFAEGTTFVELLFQRIQGEDVLFEIRTRTKEGAEWAVDIFRPFATAEELASALQQLGEGKYRQEAIADLRDSTKTLPTKRLVDSTHTRENAFDVTSETYSLPVILTSDVLQLYEREWVSCLGMDFKGTAAAPSNETGYVNLVPVNYHGAFAGNDRGSCMQCHDSAGRHATEFQDRGWYGRVPGSYSDKINSWHPFDPSCISYNGANRQVVLRREFLQQGLITWVERTLPEGYRFTEVD